MAGRNELKGEALALDSTKEENRALERKQELAIEAAKEMREEAKEKRAAKAHKQQMKLQSQQMKMQFAMLKKMGMLGEESEVSTDEDEKTD